MFEVIDMEDRKDTHDALVEIATTYEEEGRPIHFRFGEDGVFLFASDTPITDRMVDDWYKEQE